MKKLLFLFFLCSIGLLAQTNANVQYVSVAPSGTCQSKSNLRLLTPQGSIYSCQNGAWAIVTGSGGGGGGGANYISAGCGVQYTSGLSYTVGTPCEYYIAGAFYSISTNTTVTLTAADATFARIDAIIVDSSGTATKITGTPAATPAAPTVDVSTQLLLTYAYVAAMATTPTGVSTTTIYDENTEWTSAVSSGILNAGSTNNPYHLTKDTEGTAVTLNSYVTYTKPAAGTENLSNYNVLNLFIRSKSAWPTGNSGSSARRNLTISWLNGATQVGYGVLVQSGVFGFNSSTTTVYQMLSIPISLFGTGSNLVTTLKITATGNSGTSTFGFYVDWIQLQTGAGTAVSGGGNWNYQGTWNSSTTYNVNDVVQVTGSTNAVYVAATTNTNQNPINNTTYWTPLGTGSSQLNGAGLNVTRLSTGEAVAGSFIGATESVSTAGTTTTLTLAAGHTIYITGSTAGSAVKFPAANTFAGNYTYQVINAATVSVDVQDGSGGVLATLPANTQGTFFSSGISTAAGTWIVFTNSLIRSIGAAFDGGGNALTTSGVTYVVVRFGCTIKGFSAWVDTGTITFDVWKIASGTAIPTVANTILSSYIGVSSGTVNESTSTSSFTTTASAAGDIYGFKIQTVASATKAGIQIQCAATN